MKYMNGTPKAVHENISSLNQSPTPVIQYVQNQRPANLIFVQFVKSKVAAREIVSWVER